MQINTPEVTPRSGRVRIRVLYQTGLKSPGAVIRFRPTKPKGGDLGRGHPVADRRELAGGRWSRPI